MHGKQLPAPQEMVAKDHNAIVAPPGDVGRVVHVDIAALHKCDKSERIPSALSNMLGGWSRTGTLVFD